MKPLALSVGCLFLVTTFAAAGHVQSDHGTHEAAFDHAGGNEWWVEVGVEHSPGLQGVSARDRDGPWVPLEKKSWGVWAGSFHIESGNDVRFRAEFDGAWVTSCWFTHPDGKEKCTSRWQVTTIDRAGADVWLVDPVVADVDNDGTEELVTATSDGLRVYTYDGSWQLQETLAPGEAFHLLAAGDLDGDGRTDLVASLQRFDRDFARFEWDGAWQRMDYTRSADPDSAMAVGDPDGDGLDAVYTAPWGMDVPIYEVRLQDGGWHEEVVARIDEGVGVLHIGDGDGDGDDELYVGGGERGDDSLFQVEHDGSGWTKTQIGSEHGTNGVFGISTGDLDGDGRDELYHTTSVIGERHALWRNTFDGTWTQERVGSFGSSWYPLAVEVADADNDGADEVYVGVRGVNDHRIQEVEYAGGAWTKQRIAVLDGGGDPRIVSGDVDGDGLTELYAVEERRNGFIHAVSEHSPASGGDLTFDHRGGNEWWVEVHIEGSSNVWFVHAEDSSGETKQLRLSDWGNWVGSFHIEPGDEVRFWVNDRDGTPAQVSCWFTHPEGKTPDGGQTCGPVAAGPPSSEAEVAFGPKASNEWWVETMVIADGTIETVEARADGGAWHTLEKKSWGPYAASFYAPDGSIVEFRATLSDGNQAVSDGFLWPQADVVGGTGAWPEEGSYAHYSISWGSNGADMQAEVDGIFVYHDGRWLFACLGADDSGQPFFTFREMAPPFGPTAVARGDAVFVEHRNTCTDGSYDVIVQEKRQEDTRREGDPVTVSAWLGSRMGEFGYQQASWDDGSGLVLTWHFSGMTDDEDGLLQDTNAPMS